MSDQQNNQLGGNLNREPIFWTTTVPGYNKVDRERVLFDDDTGEPIIERFPQSGHQGDYENRSRARGLRFVYVIRHEGHLAPIVLTNAAAHMDPNTPWGNYQRAKARFFGWYMPGSCPVALLASGELSPNQIRDRSLLDAKPCQHGSYGEEHRCPHSLSEQGARRDQNKRREDARNLNFKDPTDKLIEAGREQNREFAQTVVSAMRGGEGPDDTLKAELADLRKDNGDLRQMLSEALAAIAAIKKAK